MNRRQMLRLGTIGVAGLALDRRADAMEPPRGGVRRQDTPCATADSAAFDAESMRIYGRHFEQTRETVIALRHKYQRPVFGRVRIWDLLQKLSLCVDASDRTLYCASQLIHVQQVVAGMEKDNVADPDLYVAAIVHDLGKVLLLLGEAPENVVCANRPIGEPVEGAGLDHLVFQWNHDEFIYSRLKDHLPDHLSWLIRYHSILLPRTEPYMDERDRAYAEKYLKPFHTYDMGTKSVYRLPPANILDRHRDLIEKTFPRPLPI